MGGWDLPPHLQGWLSPECPKDPWLPVVLPLAHPTTRRTPHNATSVPGCSCSHGGHGHLPGSPTVSLSQQQALLCSSIPPRCPSFSHPSAPNSAPSRDTQLCLRLWLRSIHPRQKSTHTHTDHIHCGERSPARIPNMAPPPFLKRRMWFTKKLILVRLPRHHFPFH